MDQVLGIGEILWDVFPTGKFLGGAPANFAFHCRRAGLDARPLSRVGNDDLGRELRADLADKNIPTDLIQTDSVRPTGTVNVLMEGTSHKFVITETVAWDFIDAPPQALAAAKQARAVCFGSLAQRNSVSGRSILKLAGQCPGLRVFDINLRQHFYSRRVIEESLAVANVLKLNHEEIAVLKDMLGLAGTTIEQTGRDMLHRYDLNLVCITRAENGAMLIRENELADQPGRTVNVADTVGCGDAYTAVLVEGLLAGKPLAAIARNAARVAEFVATQSGATPHWDKNALIPE